MNNDEVNDFLTLQLLDPSGNLLVSTEREISRDSQSEYANSYWDAIPLHARNEMLYSKDVKDPNWIEYKNRLISYALINCLNKNPSKIIDSLRKAGYEIKFPELSNEVDDSVCLDHD